jgi:hypothetical protein
VPFNTTAKNVMLDALDESATQITHVGIHQMSTDPSTSTNAAGTEAAGGSPAYARQAVTWGAASGALKSNTGALTFDVPAGTYGWFSLWSASTGNTGTYRGAIPFGGSNALKGFFSVDTTLANDQLLSVAHGMSDGDRVLFYPVFSETLPTASGLSAGTVLYVVNSATNTFKVSASAGGTALDITALGGGEGYWQRIIPETFNAQGQITVAAGALVLDLTGV